MALAEPGAGDADERRALHLLDRRRPAVAHRLAETADELVEHVRDRPLVRDAALDALRHELVDVLDVALEVAVFGIAAGLHRAERAHAAVLLEPLAAREDHLARSLVGAGQEPAGHDDVRSRGDRLGNVTRGAEPPVADHGDSVRRRGLGAVVDRGHLGNANPGDDAGRADRARPDAYL